jgi:16S rRNA (adenine1518-N6/adenine1519-N6)-dimethyltransferase
VQLELAERLFGKPGGADYGPLAALLALCATGRILRRVGPEVFWPRPRVSSAVVELDLPPWDGTALRWDEASGFRAFLQRVFGQRRKTLRAILKEALPAAHRLAKMRAEDVAAAELLRLFREMGTA